MDNKEIAKPCNQFLYYGPISKKKINTLETHLFKWEKKNIATMKYNRKQLLRSLSFPVQALLHRNNSTNQCCHLLAIKQQNQLLLFLWSQSFLLKFLVQNHFASQKHDSERQKQSFPTIPLPQPLLIWTVSIKCGLY